MFAGFCIGIITGVVVTGFAMAIAISASRADDWIELQAAERRGVEHGRNTQ